MNVVLADFRPVYLTEAVDQRKLLTAGASFAEFVAEAEASRNGQSCPERTLAAVRAAWERYGVSPDHIASRRISVLPDAEAAKESF